MSASRVNLIEKNKDQISNTIDVVTTLYELEKYPSAYLSIEEFSKKEIFTFLEREDKAQGNKNPARRNKPVDLKVCLC
jgi:hypothetical protein